MEELGETTPILGNGRHSLGDNAGEILTQHEGFFPKYPFENAPHMLVWIQVGGVTRKTINAQPRTAFEKAARHRRYMRWVPIKYDRQMPRDVLEKLS